MGGETQVRGGRNSGWGEKLRLGGEKVKSQGTLLSI